MDRNLKKILITGASLLMMASVGASMSSINNVHASHFKRTTLPRKYWGNWIGTESDRGRIRPAYRVSLWRNGGYYRATKDDKGHTVITRGNRIYHSRYLAWPYKIEYSNPNPFHLLNHNTLEYSEDTTTYYLHRAHHHYVKRHAKRHVRHYRSHRHARRHIRHGHKSHRHHRR